MRYIDSWLTGLGLEYVIPKLKANNITTPKKLAQLTLRDMYEIVGVEDAEDRKKLYFLIQRLHSILNKDSPSNKSKGEEDIGNDASPGVQSSVPSAGHTPDSLTNSIPDKAPTKSTTHQKRDDELMKSTGTERSNGSEEDLRVLRRNRRNSIETSNRSKAASKPIDTVEEEVTSVPSSGRGPVKVPVKSTTSAKRTGLTGSSSARQIDTSASPAKRPTTRSASARNVSASSAMNRPVSKRVASARTVQTVTDDEPDKPGPSNRNISNTGKQRQQPVITNKPPLSPGRGVKPVSAFGVKPSQTSGVSKVKSMRHESGVPSPPSPLAIRHTNPQERRDLQRRLSAEYLNPSQQNHIVKEHQQHRRSPSDDVDYAAAYDYDDEINQYRPSSDNDEFYNKHRESTDSVEQYETERNHYPSNTDDYSDYEAEVEEVRTWDENEEYDNNNAYSQDEDTPIEDMAIRVVLRKRPISRKELANGDYDVLEMQRGGVVDVHEPKTKVDLTKVVETQRFVFDDAFDETETNEVIYRRTMQHLMRFAFEGGKASCFAYGQTGSGKTFSMMGSRPDAPQEATVNAGLYVLAARDVFSLIEEPQYSHLKVMVSCFEIYGGKLFDLLNDRGVVRCLEDAKQQVQIKGLSEHEVQNVEELLHIMACAHEQRSTGSTGANDESSRSHQILQLCIKEPTQVIRKYGRDVIVPAKGGADGRARGGKISFIDLAGSERGADTNHSSKQTRMEGAEINTSLLALKEVIRSLERKHGHTPFRGSKLTQVLKDSFVGEKTRTCMIACVSPSHSNCEHTLNTLRYADRVKEHRSGGSAVPTSHVGSSNYDSLAYNANLAQRPRTANPAIESRATDASNYDDGEVVSSRSRSSLLVKQPSGRPKTASISSEERAPVLDHKRRAEKENMMMQQRRIESAQNLRSSAINGINSKSNRVADSMSNRAKSVNTAGSHRKSLLSGGLSDVTSSSPNRAANSRNGSRRSLLVPGKSRQPPPPPPIQQENIDDSFSKRPPSAVGRTTRRASTGANHSSARPTEDNITFKRVGSSSSSHNPSLDYNDVYLDPTLGSGSEKRHRRDISDSKSSGRQLSISVDTDELLALPAEHLHDGKITIDDEDNSELYGNDAGVVSDDEAVVDGGRFDSTEVIQRTVGLLSAHKLAIAEMVEVMKDEMELVQEMENVDDRNSELYIDKLERILAIKSEAIGSLRNELNSFQQFRSAIDV